MPKSMYRPDWVGPDWEFEESAGAEWMPGEPADGDPQEHIGAHWTVVWNRALEAALRAPVGTPSQVYYMSDVGQSSLRDVLPLRVLESFRSQTEAVGEAYRLVGSYAHWTTHVSSLRDLLPGRVLESFRSQTEAAGEAYRLALGSYARSVSVKSLRDIDVVQLASIAWGQPDDEFQAPLYRERPSAEVARAIEQIASRPSRVAAAKVVFEDEVD
jgi:hypothetical protein